MSEIDPLINELDNPIDNLDQLIQEGDRILAKYRKAETCLYIPDTLTYLEGVKNLYEYAFTSASKGKTSVKITDEKVQEFGLVIPEVVPLPDFKMNDDYSEKAAIIDIAIEGLIVQLCDANNRDIGDRQRWFDPPDDAIGLFDHVWTFKEVMMRSGYPGVSLLSHYGVRPTFHVSSEERFPDGTFVIVLPDGLLTWTLQALAHLENSNRPNSESDKDIGARLRDYGCYSAAYALFLWDAEGSYSEESIRAFEGSFQAYYSLHATRGAASLLDGPDKPITATIQIAQQVPVGLHLFNIKAKGSEWVSALKMYAHAISCMGALESKSGLSNYRYSRLALAEDYWNEYEGTIHEQAKLVFSKIKMGAAQGVEWQEIESYIQMILNAATSAWIDPDAELTPYWREALGWLQGSKLEPDNLREYLEHREEDNAAQRLTEYFFDAIQWKTLPELSQKSLVNADMIWFSPRRGNPGAVLEQIQIAVREILYKLFWEPCYKWIDDNRLTGLEVVELLNLRRELSEDRKDPSLFEFESMLGYQGFNAFLSAVKIPDDDKEFIRKRLIKDIRSLRRTRNVAEHEIGKVYERREVAPLYKKFLGLEQEGILPRLASIKALLDKQHSLPIRPA